MAGKVLKERGERREERGEREEIEQERVRKKRSVKVAQKIYTNNRQNERCVGTCVCGKGGGIGL